MVLGVVVELGAREERAKTTVVAELVGPAWHSHPLTPQLCLQSGVEVMGDLHLVQVLLTAQVLGAQAHTWVAPYLMVQRGLMAEATEVGAQIGLAMVVLGAQALSSSATELLILVNLP
jgi:hypothetical protein